jgi:hypothetical protein
MFLVFLKVVREMYSIYPGDDAAKKARNFYSHRMKESIAYLLQECSTKLGLQDSKVELVLSEIQTIERISPELHYCHHILQSAMRSQDIIGAKAAFFKIIDIICDTYSQPEWLLVSSIDRSPWEDFARAEAIRLAKEDLGIIGEVDPLSESDLSSAKDSVSAALYTIARYDPGMFDEIHEHIRIIKLFRGKAAMGLTDVRIMGAMLIGLPLHDINPVLYFLENIVHETSHIHLNCLMAMDPLILNSPDERFASPLRPDQRPMAGVLHATYVSARISQTFSKLYLATKNRGVLQTLAETLDETIRGLSEIRKNGKLTLHGQQLFDSMDELVKSAKTLDVWKHYNFKEMRTHRFGEGVTQVDELQKMVI